MEQEIIKLSDKSEHFTYNIGDLPLFFKLMNRQEKYSRGNYACHWHTEMQLLYVLKGEMDYFINGDVIHLVQGAGVFINSRRLHNNIHVGNSICNFMTVMIHPDLFSRTSETMKSYIEQKTSLNCVDYIPLSSETQWQSKAIQGMFDLETLLEGHEPDPMAAFFLASMVCAEIFGHIESVPSTVSDRHMQASFLKMTDFIKENYPERLMLSDIARAGAVSSSKCSQLFNQYVKQSPMAYLKKYRIAKSENLLLNTDISVTDVALSCGFQTSSYFISTFKKETGETPLSYRRAASVS